MFPTLVYYPNLFLIYKKTIVYSPSFVIPYAFWDGFPTSVKNIYWDFNRDYVESAYHNGDCI